MVQSQAVGRISSILLKNRVISPEAYAEAEQDARSAGMRIEKYLVEKKIVRSEDMVLALSDYLKMPPIRLRHFTPDPHLIELIPRDTIARRLAIPIARLGNNLTVALGDPFDLVTIDELSSLTGLDVTPVVATESEIGDSIAKLFAESSQGLDMEELMRDTDSDVEVVEDSDHEQSLDEMLESAEGAPVIRMVNMILVEALRTGSSDIHIEPMEKRVRLRYRIDGKLEERPGPPKNLQAAVISRVKIMSDLDIAERRVPQDGRFNIKALGKTIDLRVSILPTSYGEKVVMRLLDKTSLAGSVGSLGLDAKSEESLLYAIGQPHGIILVTGPTGSGKTTTLYSCLQDLNQPDVNIITCEDPVEYQLEGINQVQINADVGLSFASSLRSILRQDPDIVLVGEIRDTETAEIAVKAALTGHLVLSTVHTNDAPSTINRLLNMGIEPFLISSSVNLIMAQRLARVVCPKCREAVDLPASVLLDLGVPEADARPITAYHGTGCSNCGGTGFRGRTALYEVMAMTDSLRESVLSGASSAELKRQAMAEGMRTLRQSGVEKILEGQTTVEEVMRVTMAD